MGILCSLMRRACPSPTDRFEEALREHDGSLASYGRLRLLIVPVYGHNRRAVIDLVLTSATRANALACSGDGYSAAVTSAIARLQKDDATPPRNRKIVESLERLAPMDASAVNLSKHELGAI